MSIRKLLVVEDEEYWWDLIEDILKDAGFDFDIFVRGFHTAEGFQLLHISGKKITFDQTTAGGYFVALVDGKLSMSDLNGIAVTAALVKSGIPVIATSGADSFNDEMVDAGAFKAIRKDNLWLGFSRGQLTYESLMVSVKP